MNIDEAMNEQAVHDRCMTLTTPKVKCPTHGETDCYMNFDRVGTEGQVYFCAICLREALEKHIGSVPLVE